MDLCSLRDRLEMAKRTCEAIWNDCARAKLNTEACQDLHRQLDTIHYELCESLKKTKQ